MFICTRHVMYLQFHGATGRSIWQVTFTSLNILEKSIYKYRYAFVCWMWVNYYYLWNQSILSIFSFVSICLRPSVVSCLFCSLKWCRVIFIPGMNTEILSCPFSVLRCFWKWTWTVVGNLCFIQVSSFCVTVSFFWMVTNLQSRNHTLGINYYYFNILTYIIIL